MDASKVRALARGCAVLGSGGGGDPGLGLAMALLAIAEQGPVDVVDVAALDAGRLVMPCGMVGAPSVADERMWNGAEGNILRDVVERVHDRPVGALMCVGIGGANGLLPVTWAARTGLPLLDADGMGRTFSRLGRQAMSLAGVPMSPVVLTDGCGNTLLLDAADDAWAEHLAEGAAARLGGVCAGALCCMSGERARGAVIPGSLSLAVRLGEAMGTASIAGRLAGIREALDAVVLIQGTVVDLERQAEAGVARGSLTIRGSRRDARRQLRLELQSEFLLAIEDGVVCAAAPDLICVLALDTGEPISSERLRYGQAVAVIAAPAPPVWHGGPGLQLAGPRAFGYDVDHTPLGAEAAGHA
jgi:DUF917 family protein